MILGIHSRNLCWEYTECFSTICMRYLQREEYKYFVQCKNVVCKRTASVGHLNKGPLSRDLHVWTVGIIQFHLGSFHKLYIFNIFCLILRNCSDIFVFRLLSECIFGSQGGRFVGKRSVIILLFLAIILRGLTKAVEKNVRIPKGAVPNNRN